MPMKRRSLLLFLALSACSGGGSDGAPDADTSTAPGQRVGHYALLDHEECSQTLDGFIVSKSGTDYYLTLTDRYSIYLGSESFKITSFEANGRQWFNVAEIACTGTFPTSQEDADNISAVDGIEVDADGVVVVCTDRLSSDGVCVQSYSLN